MEVGDKQEKKIGKFQWMQFTTLQVKLFRNTYRILMKMKLDFS